jgi:hypothetical protein
LPLNAEVRPVAANAYGQPGGRPLVKIDDALRPNADDNAVGNSGVVIHVRIVDEARPVSVPAEGTVSVLPVSISDETRPEAVNATGTVVQAFVSVSDDIAPAGVAAEGTVSQMFVSVSDDAPLFGVGAWGTIAETSVSISDEFRPVAVNGEGTSRSRLPISVGDSFRPVAGDAEGTAVIARPSVSDDAAPVGVSAEGTVAGLTPLVQITPLVFNAEGTVSVPQVRVAIEPAVADGEGTVIVALPSVSDSATPEGVGAIGTAVQSLASVSDSATPVAVPGEGTAQSARVEIRVQPGAVAGEGTSAFSQPTVSDEFRPEAHNAIGTIHIHLPMQIGDSMRPAAADADGTIVQTIQVVVSDTAELVGANAEGTVTNVGFIVAAQTTGTERATGSIASLGVSVSDQATPVGVNAVGTARNARVYLDHTPESVSAIGTAAAVSVSVSDEFRPTVENAVGTSVLIGIQAAIQPTNVVPAEGTVVTAPYTVSDEFRPTVENATGAPGANLPISIGDSFRPVVVPGKGTVANAAVRVDDEFRPEVVNAVGTTSVLYVGVSNRPVGVAGEGTISTLPVQVSDEASLVGVNAIGTARTAKPKVSFQPVGAAAEGTVVTANPLSGFRVTTVTNAEGSVSGRPAPYVAPLPVGVPGEGSVTTATPSFLIRPDAPGAIGTVGTSERLFAAGSVAVNAVGTVSGAAVVVNEEITPEGVPAVGSVANVTPALSVSPSSIENAEGSVVEARCLYATSTVGVPAEGTSASATAFLSLAPTSVPAVGSVANATPAIYEQVLADENATGTVVDVLVQIGSQQVGVPAEGTSVDSIPSISLERTPVGVPAEGTAITDNVAAILMPLVGVGAEGTVAVLPMPNLPVYVIPVGVGAIGTVVQANPAHLVTVAPSTDAVTDRTYYGQMAVLDGLTGSPELIVTDPAILADPESILFTTGFSTQLPDGTVNAVLRNPNGGYYVGGSFGLVFVQANGTVVSGPTFNGVVHDIVWAQDLPGVTTAGIIVGGTFAQVTINGSTVTRQQIATFSPSLTTLYGATQDQWTNGEVYTLCATPFSVTNHANFLFVGGEFTYNGGGVARAVRNMSQLTFAADLSSATVRVTANSTSIGNFRFQGTPLEFAATRVTKIIHGGAGSSAIFIFGDFSEVYRDNSSGDASFARRGAAAATLSAYTANTIYFTLTVTAWDPTVTGGVPYTAALTTDGIYMGGSFTTVSGVAASHLARVSSASATDASVLSCATVSDVVTSIAHLSGVPGAGTFIAGDFSTVAGEVRRGLAKLSAGTLQAGYDLTLHPFGLGTRFRSVIASGSNVVATRSGPGVLSRENVRPPVAIRVAPVTVAAEGTAIIAMPAKAVVPAVVNAVGSVANAIPYVAERPAGVGTETEFFTQSQYLSVSGLNDGRTLVQKYSADFGGTVRAILADPQNPGGFFVGGTFGVRRVSPTGVITSGLAVTGGPVLCMEWAQNVGGVTTPGLFIGGEFLFVGGVARDYIACLSPDLQTLRAAYPVFNARVTALMGTSRGGSFLFALGDFTWRTSGLFNNKTSYYFAGCLVAGDLSSSTRRQWFNSTDGQFGLNWNGTGVPLAMAQGLATNNLYVVGSFTQYNPDGESATNRTITRNRAISFALGVQGGANPLINARTWHPNLDSTAETIIAVSGGGMFIGGQFTTVGGLANSFLARVADQDAAVTPLAAPVVNGRVRHMINYNGIDTADDGVIVKGDFTTIGGFDRPYLAKIKNSSVTAGSDWPSSAGKFRSISPTAEIAASGNNIAIWSDTNIARQSAAPVPVVYAAPVGVGAAGTSADTDRFYPGMQFVDDDLVFAGPMTITLSAATHFAPETYRLFEVTGDVTGLENVTCVSEAGFTCTLSWADPYVLVTLTPP